MYDLSRWAASHVTNAVQRYLLGFVVIVVAVSVGGAMLQLYGFETNRIIALENCSPDSGSNCDDSSYQTPGYGYQTPSDDEAETENNPTPTPTTSGHPHNPPLKAAPGDGGFGGCLERDTSSDDPQATRDDCAFSSLNNPANRLNSRLCPKLVYGGNITNKCQETFHFLFFATADGDIPASAFHRFDGGAYLIDVPGRLENNGQPKTTKWRIEFDARQMNCGKVRTFSSWRRYNVDPKDSPTDPGAASRTGYPNDFNHELYDHPQLGGGRIGNDNFPNFATTWDYGVPCTGANQHGVPPPPANLKVTCTATKATLTWNIPTGATANGVLRSIDNGEQAFIAGIGLTQTTFVDNITPGKLYKYTHKSAPNVRSTTVSCGSTTTTPTATLKATCTGQSNPSVALTWTIVSGATQNIISKRNVTDNQSLPDVLNQTTQPFATTKTDNSGLILGKTYQYSYKTSPSQIAATVGVPVSAANCNGTTFPIAGCEVPPPPNHPILFGYYNVDDKNGDRRNEVDSYTNLIVISRFINISPDDTNPAIWLPKITNQIERAAVSGKSIYLYLDFGKNNTPEDVDRVLRAAGPFWSAVALIDIVDEWGGNKADLESKIADVRSKIAALNLQSRPIGVTLSQDTALQSDVVNANGLDFVAIEAYVEPPQGLGSTDASVGFMNNIVNQMKSRVPSSKKLVIIMQAYDRNGQFTNIAQLKELQIPAYDLAREDPRVLAITMFSYSRPGGSRSHPELKQKHKLIAQALGIGGLDACVAP